MFFQFCVRFSLPRSYYTRLLLHSTKLVPDLDFLSRQRLVIASKLSMTNGATGNSGHSFQDNAPFSIHDQFDQANCGLKMQEIAPFCFIFLEMHAPGPPLGTRAIASHASLPLFLQKGLAGMPFTSDKKFVWGGGIESRCHERPAVSHRRRHGSRTDLEHGARAQRAELTNHERRQSTAGFA